jgi:hypothetical protein
MIVCNMYRSPSRQPGKFIEFIDQTLARINRHKNKHILFVGDFNVDLLKYENDVNSQNLIDTMASYSFIQTVAKPTRITDHSATLIDHVYSNKVASVTSTNLVTYDIADHLGVVTTVLISKQSESFMSPTIKREHENREYRVFNTTSTDQFHDLIMGESWEAVHSEKDAQLKYEKFAKLYNKHYDTLRGEIRIVQGVKYVRYKPWEKYVRYKPYFILEKYQILRMSFFRPKYSFFGQT